MHASVSLIASLLQYVQYVGEREHSALHMGAAINNKLNNK